MEVISSPNLSDVPVIVNGTYPVSSGALTKKKMDWIHGSRDYNCFLSPRRRLRLRHGLGGEYLFPLWVGKYLGIPCPCRYLYGANP